VTTIERVAAELRSLNRLVHDRAAGPSTPLQNCGISVIESAGYSVIPTTSTRQFPLEDVEGETGTYAFGGHYQTGRYPASKSR